jgi:hypothetical protein
MTFRERPGAARRRLRVTRRKWFTHLLGATATVGLRASNSPLNAGRAHPSPAFARDAALFRVISEHDMRLLVGSRFRPLEWKT